MSAEVRTLNHLFCYILLCFHSRENVLLTRHLLSRRRLTEMQKVMLVSQHRIRWDYLKTLRLSGFLTTVQLQQCISAGGSNRGYAFELLL